MQRPSPVVEPAGEQLVRHYLDNPLSRSLVIGEASERLSWRRSHPMYPSRERLARYYATAQAVLVETQGNVSRLDQLQARRDLHAEYAKRLSFAGHIKQLALNAMNTSTEIAS
ncbi:hypothetical protein ACPF7Z_08940 [Halomonas sp. GXIMD04776]|uniref:hypothetical protein n=1 Tax=Halomonas sp. GXIMD04776 TaxID=3415605 RepID=UPI003CB94198